MFITLFACVLLFHGIFHLLGFFKAFGIFRLEQIKKDVSKLDGVLWLIVGILFIICFFSFLWREEWWKLLVITAVLSQLLIFKYWTDTKYATPINILIVAVSIMAFSTWSFNRDVEGRIQSDLKHQHMHKIANADTSLYNLGDIESSKIPPKICPNSGHKSLG